MTNEPKWLQSAYQRWLDVGKGKRFMLRRIVRNFAREHAPNLSQSDLEGALKRVEAHTGMGDPSWESPIFWERVERETANPDPADFVTFLKG